MRNRYKYYRPKPKSFYWSDQLDTEQWILCTISTLSGAYALYLLDFRYTILYFILLVPLTLDLNWLRIIDWFIP